MPTTHHSTSFQLFLLEVSVRGEPLPVFLDRMVVLWRASQGTWNGLKACGGNATANSVGRNVIGVFKNHLGFFKNIHMISFWIGSRHLFCALWRTVLSLAFWGSENAHFLLGHQSIRCFLSRCQDEQTLFSPDNKCIGMDHMLTSSQSARMVCFLFPRTCAFSLVQGKL